MIYQAYGMLRFCDKLMQSKVVAGLASLLEVEEGLALYVLILGLGGVCILDGTTQSKRMRKDLEVIHRVAAGRELPMSLNEFFLAFEALLSGHGQS